MEKLEDAFKMKKDVRIYKDSLEQSKRDQVSTQTSHTIPGHTRRF